MVDLQGTSLVLEHIGRGVLVMRGLQFEQIELRHGARNLTRLSGAAAHLQLVLVAPPHREEDRSGREEIEDAARVDASALHARSIDASVEGGLSLQLGGSCEELVVHLGAGEIEAAKLTVAHADITIHGSGHVQLGELKALDVTTSGSGTLRYQGDPVIGRQQLRP